MAEIYLLARFTPNGSTHIVTRSEVLADPDKYGDAKFAGPFRTWAAARGAQIKALGIKRNSPAGSRPQGRSLRSRMWDRCY